MSSTDEDLTNGGEPLESDSDDDVPPKRVGMGGRVEHFTVAERAARGKATRADVPRTSHGDWEPAAHRPDPVELLEEQAQTRVPELVPIRYGRMLVSPFTFYRGARVPDGVGPRQRAAYRPPYAAMRRRPPVQFRRLRRSGPQARLQPQRLRRDAARARSSGTSNDSWRASPSPVAIAASTRSSAR